MKRPHVKPSYSYTRDVSIDFAHWIKKDIHYIMKQSFQIEVKGRINQ